LAGCVALLGAVAFLAACGSSARHTAPVYTRAASASCLLARADATIGLPPTSPARPPLVFVDELRQDYLYTEGFGHRPGPHTQLGVWTSGKNGYDGVILSFFRSPLAARSSLEARPRLFSNHERVGNVVAMWDQHPKPRPFRKLVLDCLRATPIRHQPHPAPKATLATFAGNWGGHDRNLRIGASGVGVENGLASCCVRVYAMTYRILRVHGTVTHATADIRVTAYRTFKSGNRPVKQPAGQLGKLVIDNGILTNKLTNDFFCSSPAWGVSGACGA
jgi:hypothetical protein